MTAWSAAAVEQQTEWRHYSARLTPKRCCDCWFRVHHFTHPLTARVVGAPQMISQPVFSIFPCSPLPSGTWRSPGLSIPWCCRSTSFFVRLVLFPLSLCLARWFWTDLMNGRHDHITSVCVCLRWSGGLRVVRLPATSCTDFLVYDA